MIDNRTTRQIITDWAESNKDSGYGVASINDRPGLIVALVEELKSLGKTREEVESRSVIELIKEKCVPTNSKKLSAKSKAGWATMVEKNIETACSQIFYVKEKQNVPEKTITKSVLVVESSLPEVINLEEQLNPNRLILSEERKAELDKRFNFVDGNDEDLL